MKTVKNLVLVAFGVLALSSCTKEDCFMDLHCDETEVSCEEQNDLSTNPDSTGTEETAY